VISSEGKALQLSENRRGLRCRLLSAKSCLRRNYGALFSTYSFESKKKRLVSGCGKFALQWKLRAFPESQISYENQQTNIGIVILEKVKS
jgi:hypothetical protein